MIESWKRDSQIIGQSESNHRRLNMGKYEWNSSVRGWLQVGATLSSGSKELIDLSLWVLV